MSKYKVGDKFIVEIDDVMLGSTAENKPTALYRIKGFNSLVFDKNGLDKLEKIPTSDAKDWSETIEAMEREYNRGLNGAWELARKIVLKAGMGGICYDDFKKIFGVGDYVSVLRTMTAQEALAKIEAYEKSKQIEVGDVVKVFGKSVAVTRVSEDYKLVDAIGMGGFAKTYRICECTKTGRHIDIEHLLEQIRGNE